jgi:hypothetical protein
MLVVIGTDCIGSCKSNFYKESVAKVIKTDGHDITEILLKVALNTINLNKLIKVCILYISYESLTKSTIHQLSGHLKLEAQWAQPVSLIFHSALRKQRVHILL